MLLLDYHYTNQSDTTTVEGVDDASDFKEVSEAMEYAHLLICASLRHDIVPLTCNGGMRRHCGFTTDEQHVVFQLLAGILHLGNVTFDTDNQDNAELGAAAKACADDVSALFGIDAAQLQKNLVSREVKTRNEKFDKPLSVQDAGYVRDALSKAIYAKMFDWLVLRVDDALRTETTPRSFIGVLDIYGFEFFELNSFEQVSRTPSEAVSLFDLHLVANRNRLLFVVRRLLALHQLRQRKVADALQPSCL